MEKNEGHFQVYSFNVAIKFLREEFISKCFPFLYGRQVTIEYYDSEW